MGLWGADPPERRARGAAGLAPPTERERLIAAMAASCATRGYAATQIADITAAAAVSQGRFEQHFADKAECALTALNETLAEVTRVVAAASGPERADWEKLLGGLQALLELLAARPSAAQLACAEARQSMPPEAYALYESGIRVLVAMLDRTRAYANATVPPTATRAAIGGGEALIRRELLAGRPERLPGLLPDIVYGLLVPYLDQQEALRYAELARERVNEGGVR